MKTHLMLIFVLALASVTRGNPGQGGEIPVTGSAAPGLESFDHLMVTFLKTHEVPGASLAVSRNGRLLYARAFGWADVTGREPAQPESIFRIASISKPFTATAILQLAEQKKLKLDDKAFSYIPLEPPRGKKRDPRLTNITIRQLLQQRGGWDKDKSFDPMFRAIDIAAALGVPAPASPRQIITFMLGERLQFEPGEQYVYANFGYCVLGRVIEEVTREPYEKAIEKLILTPLKLRSMRLARSRIEDRAKGEVRYYFAGDRQTHSVFASDRGKSVPIQYGGFCIESMDSHGGWLASAADLVRFANAFDDGAGDRIVSNKSIATMFETPPGAAGFGRDKAPQAGFYGCGWQVRPVGKSGQVNAWHTGRMAGSSTILVRRFDAMDWAVLFNTDKNPQGHDLAGLIDPLVHEAAAKVKHWPAE